MARDGRRSTSSTRAARSRGDKVSVEARVWDLKARKLILGRRYSGGVGYVERIAHTLANDLVKYFTGKNGLFLSIDRLRLRPRRREDVKEIYAMDFDGRNVRAADLPQLALAMNPDARGGKIALHELRRDLLPQLWIDEPRTGRRQREIPTGVDLNASPAPLAGRHARSPSPGSARRATPTSTSSARAAAACSA